MNTPTTTTEGRSFERPVRPTHCEGLPIVAWRFTWDDGGDGCGSVHYSACRDFDDDEQPDEVAALVMATDVAHKIETLRTLIANDSHACTFQSLGQYRSALLAALSNTEVSGCLRAPMPEDAPRTAAGSPLDRPVGPVAGA